MIGQQTEFPITQDQMEGGWAYSVGYFMMYTIVLSVAFAVVRNLFSRVYQRLNGDKPVDWGKRFRRI